MLALLAQFGRHNRCSAITAGNLFLVLLSAGDVGAQAGATPEHAEFGGELASNDTLRLTDWVVAAHDNQGMPFVVVDKLAARVYLFDARGRLQGAAPALLGLASGDTAIAGIGERKLADIGPKDRVTPAGRFVASLGHDLGKSDVLWVDYASGVALHRVITSNPSEHRLQRLAAASPLAHRISYGCINVPAAFFDTLIDPAFAATNGIVYILPEIKPIEAVFPGYTPPTQPASAPANPRPR
jgi:hypothetical protein